MFEKFLGDPNFLMSVFETMKDGLMMINCDGKIVFFNRAAEEITGFKKEEVLGQSCMILDTDTCVFLSDSGRQRRCDLFSKNLICDKRCRIRARDGRSVYLLKNAVVIRDDGGEIVGAVETMTDITSLYMKEMELEELKEELRQEYWFMGLLGKSAPMQRLYEQIRNAAESDASVLICGESGTGKNLVASAIHKLSKRKGGPYVAMNCASLNDHLLESELFGHKKGSFTGAINDRIGRFEAADSGTILLDEIGDMPLLMQAKLLRVLEEKVVERVGDQRPIPVDIRLISATNKDIENLIREESFREDLLYRINSFCIKTPPLRERPEDIPVIAFHYLRKISYANNKDIKRISTRAMDLLEQYSWPGNVRQLINAIEHSAISAKGDSIEVEDLPEYIFRDIGTDSRKENGDLRKIRSALAMFGGNKTQAAKHLGISRVTLWKKLKEMEAR
jgi:two-component system response regulator HydG